MTKRRDRAIVLRRTAVNELDLTVTLLTRYHGVHTALLRYAQKPGNKLNGRLHIGAHVDVELYRHTVITHVQLLEATTHDYVPLMMAAIEQLAGQGPSRDLYELAVETLRMKTAPQLTAVFFLIKSMDLSGWGPALGNCALCGATNTPAFHAASGGSVCNDCRPAGSTTVPPQVIELLTALRAGRATKCHDNDLHQALTLTVALFQTQLECQLPVT